MKQIKLLCQMFLCVFMLGQAMSHAEPPPPPGHETGNNNDAVVIEILSPTATETEKLRYAVSVKMMDCEINCNVKSSIDENTSLFAADGSPVDLLKLQSAKPYQVDYIRFDDKGNHRISVLALKLKANEF